MEIWNKHPTTDILSSLEAELSKAQNEINCATKDISKAKNRIAFSISAVHNLKTRDLQDKKI